MNIQRERLRCLPMSGLAYFGGDSSSATENKTENRDMRVVGGEGSSNVSANDSTVSVITTDHGAVQAGMELGTQLGTKAINAADAASARTGALASDMFKNALAHITDSDKRALGAVSSANANLAQAYQNGQAGDQTQLKFAGFIVVGLAAVALLAKR